MGLVRAVEGIRMPDYHGDAATGMHVVSVAWAQIVAVYGEPTGYDGEQMISYELGQDKGVFGTGLMGSPNMMHYYIYFDGNGKAYKIQEGCQIGG